MKQAIVKQFAFHALSKGLSYALLLIYANWFIKEEYGQASFWLSLFFLATCILYLGLPHVFVPFLVKRRAVYPISLVLLGASIVLLPPLWKVVPAFALPLLLFLPLDLVHKYQLASLQSIHRHDLYQLTYVVSIIMTFPGLYVFRDQGAFGILFAIVIGKAVSVFAFLPWIRLDPGRDRVSLREYLRQAWPIAIVSFSFLLLFWVDSVILGLLGTPVLVAEYSVAGMIAGIIIMVPFGLSMFILTRSSEQEQVMDTVKKTMRISFFLASTIFILLVAGIRYILAYLFPAYLEIGLIVVVLGAGIIGYSLYSILIDHNTGRQKPKESLPPIILGVVVNIILDIALIPFFGILGIAIATAVSHVLITLLFLWKMDLCSYSPYLIIIPLAALAYLMGIYGALLIFALPFLLMRLGLLRPGDIRSVMQGLSKPSS